MSFVGRDVVVKFAIALETADPTALTFKRLGMMRTKDWEVQWDDVDTTGDTSPDFTRTALVTFKSINFSGDGVSYEDTAQNQSELEGHVFSPGAATGNQPKAWLQIEFPDFVYVGPFIFTQFSRSAPYDDAVTWSTAAKSNGQVTRTAA